MDVTNPRTMTELEAELIRNIGETIVEPQVMEPMERIGWSHGQPPDPMETPVETATEAAPVTETLKPESVPATTAPTAEKSVTTTTIDWESLRNPDNGLIVGKYKTESEAVKGVSHAVEMAKQALNKASLLEQENAKLRESLVQRPIATFSPETRPDVTTTPEMSNDLDLVLGKIVEEGGMLDENTVPALKAAFLAMAERTVSQALTQKDTAEKAEQESWNKVDSFMRQNHPDSINFTDEINLFVNTDPLTGEVVRTLVSAGKKQEAAVIAWQNYARAAAMDTAIKTQVANVQKEEILTAGDQVRKEIVDAARIDAGVVATSVGGVHETPNISTSREEIEAAAAGMAAGDVNAARIWRAMTVGKDLSGPLFD